MNLKYKHYFEALPPKISLEKFNIFYSHPYAPVQVNELGYTESRDPNVVFYDTKEPGYYCIRVPGGKQIAKWRKVHFLFSCYHGLKRSPTKIFYLDGNPLNCMKSNLIGINYAPPELMWAAVDNTNEFISNTIEQISLKMKKYSKYWSANDVVHNLGIPMEYIDFWQHPKKLQEFIRANERSVEIAITRKIYKQNVVDYGIQD